MKVTPEEMAALTVEQMIERADRDDDGNLLSIIVTDNSRPHHVQPMRSADGSLIPAYAAFGTDSGSPAGSCVVCSQQGELPALLAIVSNGFGCYGRRVGDD